MWDPVVASVVRDGHSMHERVDLWWEGGPKGDVDAWAEGVSVAFFVGLDTMEYTGGHNQDTVVPE